jgi:hypothetical protein
LTSGCREAHTVRVRRARRHQRILAVLAFGLLALVAELAGRSLSSRFDFGRHVRTSYAADAYYPFLLAAVKVAVALMLAGVSWRFARARATARAGRRIVAALGHRPASAPRVRLELSARSWLLAFGVTSLFYLVQMDAEGISRGRWPLLSPWLHTAALPVFAVLAVVVAGVYGAVARWLADYEEYAAETIRHARRLTAATPPAPPRVAAGAAGAPPRRLFGLAFESRPPPAPA